MKATILGLRTTIYKVGDLEKTKAWYTKLFNTEHYFDMLIYVGFNIGGYELGVQPEEETLAKSDAVVSY